MIESQSNLLLGSYPPLVTPFSNGEIDENTYARLVEYHVAAGSKGVVVCGTTGEPSLLSVAERKRLAEVAVSAVDGRCKLWWPPGRSLMLRPSC